MPTIQTYPEVCAPMPQQQSGVDVIPTPTKRIQHNPYATAVPIIAEPVPQPQLVQTPPNNVVGQTEPSNVNSPPTPNVYDNGTFFSGCTPNQSTVLGFPTPSQSLPLPVPNVLSVDTFYIPVSDYTSVSASASRTNLVDFTGCPVPMHAPSGMGGGQFTFSESASRRSTDAMYQPLPTFMQTQSPPYNHNHMRRSQPVPVCNAPTPGPRDSQVSQGNQSFNHSQNKPSVPTPVLSPTYEDVVAFSGADLLNQTKTASGSSFIQASLKEGADERIVTLLWDELGCHMKELLLDAHGCYVMKSLMEMLPTTDVQFILDSVSNDEELGFSMCTQSLHTRRAVQHIIETIDGNFLNDLMQRRCAEVAKTQQGCIAIQRSLDHSSGQARDALIAKVMQHLVVFSTDPYANYVIQHLLEVVDRETLSESLWTEVRGNVIKLSCNKFASNVVEKCLVHVTTNVQREILTEMYGAGPNRIHDMLQDSFGNYIIQSSIALATDSEVQMIDEKLRPVLTEIPFGHKITFRLDRRLQGKQVSTRNVKMPARHSHDFGGHSGPRDSGCRRSRGQGYVPPTSAVRNHQ